MLGYQMMWTSLSQMEKAKPFGNTISIATRKMIKKIKKT
jgi:hypothetical protein